MNKLTPTGLGKIFSHSNGPKMLRLLVGDPTLEQDLPSDDWRIKFAEMNQLIEGLSESEFQVLQEEIGSLIHLSGSAEAGIYKVMEDKVKNLSDQELMVFELILVKKTLKTVVETLGQIPSLEDLSKNDFNQGDCDEALEKLYVSYNALNALDIYAEEMEKNKGSAFLSKIVSSQLHHDQGSMVQGISSSMDYYLGVREDYPEDEMEDTLNEAFHNLEIKWDIGIQLLKDIFSSNLAIIEGQFELKKFNLKQALMPAIQSNASRFKYKVQDSNTPGDPYEQPGTITADIDPDMEIYGVPEGLSIIIYNLIKNPIKISHIYKDKLIAVVISAEEVDGCISIFVRDTGTGISYDDKRDYFIQEAERKINSKESLSLVEELLIDETWGGKVSPDALNQLLFQRGVSSSGGTGVGLDIVKSIIEGHQGSVRIYNHPQYGAGVQFLIPNTDSTDPTLRKQMIENALVGMYREKLDQVVGM